MRTCARLVLFATIVLTLSCESKTKTQAPPSASNASNETDPQTIDFDSAALVPQARQVIESIAELEKEKDVTCWTSFRQLDQFIATKSYSDFATLAKIHSQKAVTLSVWEAASLHANGTSVTAKDIDAVITLHNAVVPEQQRTKLKSFATDLGMKDFEDYRKTGEHYRVLLATTTDAIAHDARHLKPMDVGGQDRMADVIMQVSLELLKASGKVATEERSPFIEGAHVKKAHASLMQTYELKEPTALPSQIDGTRAATLLAPVTGALIESKITALKHFNKTDPRSPLKTEDTLRAINEVSPILVTSAGLDALVLQLRSVARFVTGGVEPMRSDNYLSDGQFEPRKIDRRLYVDETWTENVITQIWPHLVLPNGDISCVLSLTPEPLRRPIVPLETCCCSITSKTLFGTRLSTGRFWHGSSLNDPMRWSRSPRSSSVKCFR
jgi:hypothetical protein